MAKQTVYVVTTGCYSDYSIRGVFSSEAKAKRYIVNCKASADCYWTDFNDIEKYALDAGLLERSFHCWNCGIALDNGQVLEAVQESTRYGIPHSKTYVAEDVPRYNGRGIVRAESHKSAAHSHKIAVEARQKYLREKGEQRGSPNHRVVA